MSSEHDTIGKTVVEYTANTRRITCLEKQLSDIGEHLVSLGQKLKTAPGSVAATGQGFQVPSRSTWSVAIGETVPIPISAFDTDKIREILSELSEAKRDRERLEKTLRGMGLADLIRES